ncbi:MAG: amino acid adenylation domain-containing protein, partial [Chloroflexi bacterium]
QQSTDNGQQTTPDHSQFTINNSQLIFLPSDWPKIAQEPTHNLTNLNTPNSLAYVIYTSGSTGKSKGVMIEHRNLVNAYFAWADAYDLHTVRSHLQMANFTFDVFSGDLVRALLSGGKLVLCPREWLLAPEKLVALMQEQAVDIAEFVPVVLRHLMQYLAENKLDLSFMRLLACGSDNWYVGEYKKFLRFCGPNTRLINSFGLTEATIDSCYFESDLLNLATEQVVPIGRPFSNMQLYILDSQQQPTPIGVPGELYVGGAGVARGYHNRPKLNAERFVSIAINRNPLANNGQRITDNGQQSTDNSQRTTLYRTGDRARWLPDGNVEFLGRIDHQVKIRGFRIELGEIEAVLKEHSAIRQIAVMPMAATARDKRLVAYAVTNLDDQPTTGALRRFVQERLPDYMVPSAFILLDEMPLLASGKVNRRALPAPDWSQRDLENAYVAPRTPVEEMLAEIWSFVLGVEQPGIHDNFFELGGHSLLATQLVSRIRDGFDIACPLRTIFEAPTIAALAEQVEIAQRTETGTQAPPIEPVSRDQELPLSFAQQRLWFLDQLEPNSPFYNIPEAMRFTGELDMTVLAQSLNEVIRRHESLRTTINTVDGRPFQNIHPELTITIPVVDISHLIEAEREAQATQLAQEEAKRPFSLATGPLLRATLVRLAENDHIILLTVHHIVSDNWSSNVLIQEVAVLYEVFSNGRFSPLPELTIQYADFAHWQRNWLQGDVLDSQLGFWKDQLSSSPALLELPADRPRPAVQTFAGDYLPFTLSAELTHQIKMLCRQEGVTPFMLLLAAFQTLLHRYSGQERINIGSPIANRNRADIEGLIGFFVNTLVFTSDFARTPTFREFLQQVRETALGAYAHQDLPFEMIVDAVQPERNLSHSPLFQAMFVTQNAQQTQQSQQLPDLTIRPVEAHSGTAKFDLTLFMLEDDQFSGAWEFNTDLFDRSTIERMVGHFETLLDGIVADPDQPVATLPILTEPELHQLLVTWNNTDTPIPDHLCVHQLFAAQTAQTPNAVAVRFQTQQLTYAELNAKANQLAHHLQAQGIGPETLVGVCMTRTPDLIVALLGTLKAGGAYIPIDPTYPSERIKFMIEDAQPQVIIADEAISCQLSAISQGNKKQKTENGKQKTTPHSQLTINNSQLIILPSDWPQITHYPVTNPKTEISPDNLAYVIYTSGSTGRPKGAMLEHRGVVNYLTWCQQAYPVDKGNGSPVHSSISFDLTVTSLFAPLVSGQCVHLLPEEVGIELLADALRENDNYSLVKITPAHLELLSQQLSPDQVAGKTHGFIIGGENLLMEKLVFWQQNAPNTVLVNEYGPTETVVGCCIYQVLSDDTGVGSVPIGQPNINTKLYILDNHMQPVPIGVPGELYIGGVQVGRGYLNRPELTKEKFIALPESCEP